MNTAQKINNSKAEPTQSVFTKINQILERQDLSTTEKVVMTKMLMSCGDRGWVYYGVEKFAQKIAMSESRTRGILSKLVADGFLHRTHRTSRVNIWHIPEHLPGDNTIDHEPQVARNPEPPQEIKRAEPIKNDSVESVNIPESVGEATESSSPFLNTILKEKTFKNVSRIQTPKQPNPNNTPFDISLVHEIEGIMNTSKDRGCWIKIVRECSPDIVRGAISSLRIAMNECIVSRPGAYLVQTIKAHYPELFTTSKPETTKPVINAPTVTRNPEPSVERNDELNKAGLADIKAILFGRKSLDRPDANRLNQTRITRVLGSGNSNPRGIV